MRNSVRVLSELDAGRKGLEPVAARPLEEDIADGETATDSTERFE